MEVIFLDKEYSRFGEVNWDFPDAKQDKLSRIHPYPAKFINDIPAELIALLPCSKTSFVFDPFCGSGTTLVEANRVGLNAIGVDLNPIACLISSVKTATLTSDFVEQSKSVCRTAQSKLRDGAISIPSIPNLDHWYKKDVQYAVSSLISEINRQTNVTTRNAMFLSLSSILVKVSNQESDTRYAAVDKAISQNEVFSCFLKATSKVFEAVSCIPRTGASSKIIESDIFKVRPADLPGTCDLVITSTPYPNAYEYWLYHKYRMFWLGKDPIHVRALEIGARPKYEMKNGLTEKDFSNQMDMLFSSLADIVSCGGHACFVIGRSKIKGRIINNSNILIKCANANGFALKVQIARFIATSRKSFNPSYGKIKTEDVLVFKKVSQ